MYVSMYFYLPSRRDHTSITQYVVWTERPQGTLTTAHNAAFLYQACKCDGVLFSTWMLLVDMLAQYVEVEKLGSIYVCEKCNGKNDVLLQMDTHSTHMFILIIVIFINIYISQGSVAAHLRCGGIFRNRVVANCIQNVPVKEF